MAALTCLLIAAGCTETRFEEATGEGTVRGINAVAELDSVAFLIEEIGLGSVPFKNSSSTAPYDNLTYTFNFDLFIPGETDPRRLASSGVIDVVDGQDYTFVLTGDATTQQVILWERTQRDWVGDEAVFEVEVGHLNTALGAVDVYLVPTGQAVDPTTLVGTVAFSERLDAFEAGSGEYQVIVTTQGQPADILFQGDAVTLLGGQTYIAAVFDADPSITGPASLRLYNQDGTAVEVPDERFPGTAQFINASFGLGNVDVAIAGDFTNPAVTNLGYAEVSADVEVPGESATYTYVPTGNTMPLFEEDAFVPTGARDMFILSGPPDDLVTIQLESLRRSFSTAAQFRIISTITNFEAVDIYIREPGTDINEVNPTFRAVRGFNELLTSQAGDFEITITDREEKTPLKPPEIVTFALGDIVEFVLLDDADPNAVQTLSFSNATL
ncbi:MAG: hypothetical protein AAGA61_01745 [Pseudomonadota bacterium]